MLLGLGIVLASIVPVLAEPVVIDRIAAIVNREVITLSDIEEALLKKGAPTVASPSSGRIDPDAAAALLTPRALGRELHRLINRQLELQAAKQLGIAATDEELRQAIDDIKTRNHFTSDRELSTALAAEGLTLDQYREQLRTELTVAKLINREVRNSVVVSADDAHQYYVDHPDEFLRPGRVKLRQIFIAAPAADSSTRATQRAKAQAALAQLQSGGDFAQLARRYSDGADAKDGGDIGWFAKGALMPQLDQVAFALHRGESSGLIESPAGWHILKVDDQEALRQEPFDAVKAAILERLMESKVRRRYEEWFLELRHDAYVDIRL